LIDERREDGPALGIFVRDGEDGVVLIPARHIHKSMVEDVGLGSTATDPARDRIHHAFGREGRALRQPGQIEMQAPVLRGT
jgi:hypothetical protein